MFDVRHERMASPFCIQGLMSCEKLGSLDDKGERIWKER